MTGLEVWEVWKKNPKAKFKHSEYGVEIMFKHSSPCFRDSKVEVSFRGFLESNWIPVDQWIDVEILEAIEAFLYKGKTIKRTYNGGADLFNLENGDVLSIDVFSQKYTWSIKD